MRPNSVTQTTSVSLKRPRMLQVAHEIQRERYEIARCVHDFNHGLGSRSASSQRSIQTRRHHQIDGTGPVGAVGVVVGGAVDAVVGGVEGAWAVDGGGLDVGYVGGGTIGLPTGGGGGSGVASVTRIGGRTGAGRVGSFGLIGTGSIGSDRSVPCNL